MEAWYRDKQCTTAYHCWCFHSKPDCYNGTTKRRKLFKLFFFICLFAVYIDRLYWYRRKQFTNKKLGMVKSLKYISIFSIKWCVRVDSHMDILLTIIPFLLTMFQIMAHQVMSILSACIVCSFVLQYSIKGLVDAEYTRDTYCPDYGECTTCYSDTNCHKVCVKGRTKVFVKSCTKLCVTSCTKVCVKGCTKVCVKSFS